MSWDHEPPTTPPQSGEPTDSFAPPSAADQPDESAPTAESAPTVESPPAGDSTPTVDSVPAVDPDPTVEAPPAVGSASPFEPPPTAEVPPPPPPIPPPPVSYAPPAPAAAPFSPPPTAPVAGPQPADPWGTAVPPAGAVPPVPPGTGLPPTGGAGWGGPPMPPPLPPADAPEPRKPNRALRVVGGVVVVAGLFGIGFGVRSLIDDSPTTVVQGASTVSSVPQVTIDPGSEPVAAVAQEVSPSVVQIETTEGLGSGVVYDASGLIMTNAHVVGTEKTVTVRTADGNAVEGQVLGADTGTDIAVVRATGIDAPPAALALDTKPAVGQIAVAVGSPYGLDQTVTSGIVSAVNRPVDNDKGVVVNMIQTDASINPGNSGGALANREGQIVGINTAIFSQTGENTGIGFAIPIATAKKAADQLVNGESVAKAGLGLSGPSATPNGDAGAYVESVTNGGPADQAGIKSGDLIVDVDGTPIRGFDELRGLISSHSPGDQVTVTVERDGQKIDLKVTLGTLSSSSTPTTGN